MRMCVDIYLYEIRCNVVVSLQALDSTYLYRSFAFAIAG